jgi:hypothetical protein
MVTVVYSLTVVETHEVTRVFPLPTLAGSVVAGIGMTEIVWVLPGLISVTGTEAGAVGLDLLPPAAGLEAG